MASLTTIIYKSSSPCSSSSSPPCSPTVTTSSPRLQCHPPPLPTRHLLLPWLSPHSLSPAIASAQLPPSLISNTSSPSPQEFSRLVSASSYSSSSQMRAASLTMICSVVFAAEEKGLCLCIAIRDRGVSFTETANSTPRHRQLPHPHEESLGPGMPPMTVAFVLFPCPELSFIVRDLSPPGAEATRRRAPL